MENQDLKKFQDINGILKTWNPLLVPEPALDSEYTEIIPKILSSGKDTQIIFSILEDYVINFLGTNYEQNNPDHVNELKNVAEEINKILYEK
jgi:hypothetical protein